MKAKNRKSLSARCAGVCVGADVPRRVRERDERTERGRREAHRAKERGRALKKSGLDGETREEWKESPQVFDIRQLNSKCTNFLLLEKSVSSKENAYLCNRINTTFPFFCRNAASI